MSSARSNTSRIGGPGANRIEIVGISEKDRKAMDEKNKKGKPLYIPEMIFGHLLTSTNYDKDEKKVVGGKNG